MQKSGKTLSSPSHLLADVFENSMSFYQNVFYSVLSLNKRNYMRAFILTHQEVLN